MTDQKAIELLRAKVAQDIESIEPLGTGQSRAMVGSLKQVLGYFDDAIVATAPSAQENTAAPKTDFGRAYKALQLMRNPHKSSEHAHTWDMAIADALRAVHAAEVEAAIQAEEEGK